MAVNDSAGTNLSAGQCSRVPTAMSQLMPTIQAIMTAQTVIQNVLAKRFWAGSFWELIDLNVPKSMKANQASGASKLAKTAIQEPHLEGPATPPGAAGGVAGNAAMTASEKSARGAERSRPRS